MGSEGEREGVVEKGRERGREGEMMRWRGGERERKREGGRERGREGERARGRARALLKPSRAEARVTVRHPPLRGQMHAFSCVQHIVPCIQHASLCV